MMKQLQAQYPQAALVVVDDNPTNLILIREVLKLAGYQNVRAFSHPKEVLLALREQSAEVVLADQSMPDLTGLELFVRIKLELNQDPIGFLVTALHGKDLLERAESVGMTGVINKPFDIRQLVQDIDHAISAKRAAE